MLSPPTNCCTCPLIPSVSPDEARAISPFHFVTRDWWGFKPRQGLRGSRKGRKISWTHPSAHCPDYRATGTCLLDATRDTFHASTALDFPPFRSADLHETDTLHFRASLGVTGWASLPIPPLASQEVRLRSVEGSVLRRP